MKLLLLPLLIILQACNSGGGSDSAPANNIPIENPVPITDNYIPSCDQAPATLSENGFPFHAKGKINGNHYYLICTPLQLAALAVNPQFYSNNFELGADLELFPYYSGNYELGPTNQFTIGSVEQPFSGSFNGNGYSISDFRLTNTAEHCGLFSYTTSATILNLDLESPRINATSGICAPLIGYAEKTTVLNVSIGYYNLSSQGYDFIYWSFVEGPQIAGLIGVMDNSVIDSSYSLVNLKNDTFPLSQAAGFSLVMINNSFIFNSFYDGVTQLHVDSEQGGITILTPTFSIIGEEGEAAQLIKNVTYSVQSSFTQACWDSATCNGENILLIDKNQNSTYFINQNLSPQNQWNAFIWDFSLNPQYPYPTLL